MLRGHYPHEDAYTSSTSLCLIIQIDYHGLRKLTTLHSNDNDDSDDHDDNDDTCDDDDYDDDEK